MSSHASRRCSQIGLDRLIRLKWLERTAYLALTGKEAALVKAALQEELQSAFRAESTKIRGSLDKTITNLMRIWVCPPRDLRPLQREGLEFLSHRPREEHIALHWGMAMAVYPFWGAVAAHVGRLIRLQGMVAASQVQRRMREQYGERETVSRATQRVLRSFIDWGVLKETSKKGVYAQGMSRAIGDAELIAWLVEAYLNGHANGSVALTTVLDSTSLFPFHLSPVSAAHLVAVSGRLDVLRHGLDQDLITLRAGSLPVAKSRSAHISEGKRSDDSLRSLC